jgi:hypothetical protein
MKTIVFLALPWGALATAFDAVLNFIQDQKNQAKSS